MSDVTTLTLNQRIEAVEDEYPSPLDALAFAGLTEEDLLVTLPPYVEPAALLMGIVIGKQGI